MTFKNKIISNFEATLEKIWREKLFLTIVCVTLSVIFLPRIYALYFSILMAFFSIFLFLQSPKLYAVKYFAVTYLIAFLVLLSFSGDYNSNIFLVESKLLMTPLLMAFFVLLPDHLQDPAKNLQQLIWLIVIANIGALFYTSFQFRYIDHIGFISSVSIYMGILLAVCALLVKSNTGFFWICGLVWMSGSGTALLSLFAAISFRLFSKGRWFRNEVSVVSFFLFIGVIAAIFVVAFLAMMEIRGRSLDDFRNIDRVQLLLSGLGFALDNFGVSDFLFGYGVAKVPVGIYQYFPTNSMLIPWIAESRGYENFSSLLFHNEFLRIFYNFGFVGLVSMLYVFWSFCGKKRGLPVFGILMVASFFSSTFYITPLIVPLFYIVRLWRLENVKLGFKDSRLC